MNLCEEPNCENLGICVNRQQFRIGRVDEREREREGSALTTRLPRNVCLRETLRRYVKLFQSSVRPFHPKRALLKYFTIVRGEITRGDNRNWPEHRRFIYTRTHSSDNSCKIIFNGAIIIGIKRDAKWTLNLSEY